MRKLRLLSKNCYSFTLPQKLTKLEYGGGISFESFDHLFELEINHSSKITNVELFGNIPKLRLTSLVNLISLSGLGYDENSSKKLKNRSVKIINCENVKDFHYLKNVSSVSIVYCNLLTLHDLKELKNVRKLMLFDCKGLENIMINDSYMIEMSNEELVLRGNMKEEELFFGNFGGVKRLDIRNIFFHTADVQRIQSLKGLEKLRNLERFAISNNCIECESIGWKMLKENFYQFRKKNHSFYLRKDTK